MGDLAIGIIGGALRLQSPVGQEQEIRERESLCLTNLQGQNDGLAEPRSIRSGSG
jgi:hypothetical protein